jgi:hypothetical protein
MEKFIRADAELSALIRQKRIDWVLAPNTSPEGSASASRAKSHGDFDDDRVTLEATLARITGASPSAVADSNIVFHASAPNLRTRRADIDSRGRSYEK